MHPRHTQTLRHRGARLNHLLAESRPWWVGATARGSGDRRTEPLSRAAESSEPPARGCAAARPPAVRAEESWFRRVLGVGDRSIVEVYATAPRQRSRHRPRQCRHGRETGTPPRTDPSMPLLPRCDGPARGRSIRGDRWQRPVPSLAGSQRRERRWVAARWRGVIVLRKTTTTLRCPASRRTGAAEVRCTSRASTRSCVVSKSTEPPPAATGDRPSGLVLRSMSICERGSLGPANVPGSNHPPGRNACTHAAIAVERSRLGMKGSGSQIAS